MTEAIRKQRQALLNTSTLGGYLASVQQIPVLSAEDEAALFVRFQEEGDTEAARQIVLSHLRFVVYIARGYGGYGLALEDLIQQGSVGLMKSVKRFDPAYGVRLVSFAVHWIKAEIHEFILKNWKIVKVATTKAQRKLFFNLRKAKQRLGWFREEEIAQVAENLGVKLEEVLEMEARLAGMDESFDPSSSEDDDYHASPALYLTQGDVDNPAQRVADEQATALRDQELAQALELLDERSRDIVQSRWLGEDKIVLKDLAKKYQVSLERIRQIEAQAFRKMQAFLAGA